jgi:UDP-2-acetamido-2,6-beta-L-arabino-hexul-4-ose reductase
MKVEIRNLEIIADNRGWLAEILKNEFPQTIEQIHFSFSKPGTVRGNHYHKHRIEWLFVTCGTGKVFLEDNLTKERSELTVSGDCPVLIKIFPNVTHTIVNSESMPMHLLVITNEKHGSEDSDTYHKQLVPSV